MSFGFEFLNHSTTIHQSDAKKSFQAKTTQCRYLYIVCTCHAIDSSKDHKTKRTERERMGEQKANTVGNIKARGRWVETSGRGGGCPVGVCSRIIKK